MRHKNSRKTVAKKRRAGGRWHLSSFRYGQKYVWLFISIICAVMFGNLDYYEDEQYGLSHRTICFDSRTLAVKWEPL